MYSASAATGRASFPPTKSLQDQNTKHREKQSIWVPLLNSASKGKELAEKQLIVLGGTPDQQREFLDTINEVPPGPRYGKARRPNKAPPISNKYALGYTYQDILDLDHEDVLARLNIYLLSNPSSSFAELLRPLFTKTTVPETLITILLDWSDPIKWPRQLRQWIRLLRFVLVSLDEETKAEMEETMSAWKDRRQGAITIHPGGGGVEQKQSPFVPLGPGEWDEELGIPLSVVCIHTEKTDSLERDLGWQEEQFDFLMQWLRCVLLKHGASLIYTTSYDPSSVRTLLHSSLGIHSVLKREAVKHNVIDRDKVLVPPNWDSWGKIKVLNEAFDPNTVSTGWSTEIQDPPEETLAFPEKVEEQPEVLEESSAVAVFETILLDAVRRRSPYRAGIEPEVVVTTPDMQTFLAQQAAILEELKAEDERAGRRARKGAPAPTGSSRADFEDGKVTTSRMGEQIARYQINVNGIDFDAEEATRRIREREADRNKEKDKGSGTSTPRREKVASSEDGKPNTELYANFFSGLMKKSKGDKTGGLASRSISPTRGSPAPDRSLQ